jgi:L-arabinose isomerase
VTAAGHLSGPVRVGLLTPYFSFFDEHFPPTYRVAQQRYAAELGSRLAGTGAVVTPSDLVYSAETAASARKVFQEARIEVVVIAAVMAAPPGYVTATLDGLDVPVVIWSDRRVEVLEDDINELEATRTSSFLGSVMAANVLRRVQIRFAVVTTHGADDERIGRAVRAAAVGPRLRAMRLGLIGDPIPGYDDVVLGEAGADQVGLTLVPVAVDRVIRTFKAVSGEDRTSSAALLESANAAVEGRAEPGLQTSLDLHATLRRTADELDLDALAINCHSAFRQDPDVGVVGCLGASLLTFAGRPVSCTGDGATAVGLSIATVIAGHAQYCEGYVQAGRTGELLLSSCGLADLRLRAVGEATVVAANELYPGKRGLGYLFRHGFPEGDATLIGFSPDPHEKRSRLTYAFGRLTGRTFSNLNGPSGSFIFDHPDPEEALRAWISAAPAHHMALVRGRLDLELEVLKQLLDMNFIAIGAASTNAEINRK